MLTVSNNNSLIIYNRYRDKIHQKLEQCFESNLNETKRARFSTVRNKYRRQFILTAAV